MNVIAEISIFLLVVFVAYGIYSWSTDKRKENKKMQFK